MSCIKAEELYKWCKIPFDKLQEHPEIRIPFRLTDDSDSMGRLMARELADEIIANNRKGDETRAIIPCGPSCWYKPFTDLVKSERISLRKLVVFHMDECLDWQGRELSRNHPYSFRGFMEKHFYGPVPEELNVPESQRFWLTPETINSVRENIGKARIGEVLTLVRP